ncbi:UDP-N-acetylmuramoyl-L-alanyl-D-glutamate--2,6-diaminopimelate ligase [Halobacteriovorax sp. XZX-3]|uniref:Mur ligase family protein n=1 Tax=unclassified Halobacteriovorax TaxID=2639665 RepID=UPI003713D10C
MNKLISKYKIILKGLSDLTANLDQAKPCDIAFYRIHDNEKAMALFRERYQKGSAGLVITNREVSDITTLVVDDNDFYKLQEELVEELYPINREVKLIGITGTNGKSSVAHLCQLILNANNLDACCIGTVGVVKNESEIMESLSATTPSFIDLRRIIFKLKNITYFCLEVSSHALEQERVKKMKFDSIGWTNFTQDHLDYHGTMESYFNAKAKLAKYCDTSFIIPRSQKNEFQDKLDFDLAPETKNLYGEEFNLSYNIDNLELAFALCERACGIKLNKNIKLSLPKGRFNLFRKGDSVFIVDYAHTPDAIVNICRETKKHFASYDIITLFGCGGDRDRTKRPKMLAAALEFSDKVVVTSDNPRTEEPADIINDILEGNESEVDVVVDRKEAIHKYVREYKRPTAVIIAGKGHEEYQDIKGVKHHFSDIEEVKSALGEL